MNREAMPEGPKDDNTRERMQLLGRMIDDQLPNGWGFVLLAFPFNGEPGRVNYVAKASREDVIKLLEDYLAKVKRGGWASHA